jgi:tRNA A-37 threonylcarbamoyl transferase component Bud32
MAGRQEPNHSSDAVPVIDGYSNLTSIGSGGFSQVYTAWQERFARTVAVKVITVDMSDTALRRFSREQTTTGQLDGHPHVIRVYDSGFTEQRQPYLTMEYHEQGSLADRVRLHGPMPVDEVLAIGVKLACALDAAHRLGTIHRDVKPQNVLVSPFVGPVLADFGIAAVDDARIRTITSEAFSALHVAPEVLEGHQATPASDLYSLASTMYELLAGRAPFAANEDPGLLALMRRIRTEPLPPIDRDDVPPQLSSALARLLAREIDERPGTGVAMAEALRAVQTELGLEPTPMVPDPGGAGPSPANRPPPPAPDPTEMAPPAWAQSPDLGHVAAAPAPSAPEEDGSLAPPAAAPAAEDPQVSLETTDPRVRARDPAPQTPKAAKKAPAQGARRPERSKTPDRPSPSEPDDPLTHTVTRGSQRVDAPKPLIAEEEKKSRLPLIIGVSSVVVLLAMVAGWFFLLRDSGSDDDSTTPTTEPDPADILPPCPTAVTGNLLVDGSPDVVDGQPPTELGLEQGPDGTSANLTWDDPNGGANYYVVWVRCDTDAPDNLQQVAVTFPGEPTAATIEELSIDFNYCFTVGVLNFSTDDEDRQVQMHGGDDVCMDAPTGPVD